MSDFLKIHLYSLHILPFLVKGAVNVAIQCNFHNEANCSKKKSIDK